MPTQLELVIAIDFGTTSSGVCWQTKSRAMRNPEPYFITDWPDAPSQGASLKVPSIVAYESELSPELLRNSTDVNKHLNRRRTCKPKPCKWGFSVEPDKAYVECFKLLLAEGTDLPSFADFHRSVPIMNEHKRKAVDVVADYLKSIMDHAMRNIGSKVERTLLETMTKTYVITVPACWPTEAREMTAKAFRAAGYPAPSLISEPEAAAHDAISQMTDNAPFGKDQVIMVVDAGGGTVDLISYLVQNFNPLELIEAAPGTAALCGGVTIDRAFAKHVESDMGKEDFEKMLSTRQRSWNDCRRQFENNPKVEVRARDDRTFELALPGVQHEKVKNGYYPVTSRVTREFFELPIEKMLGLMYKQAMEVRENGVNKKITHILLVGGLGASNYLYGELNRRLDKAKIGNKDVVLLQTTDPRYAVVRGALSCALRGLIKTYVANFSYGFTLKEDMDTLNANKKRARKLHDGTKIHWLLKRDQVVEHGRPYQVELAVSSMSFELEIVSNPGLQIRRDKTAVVDELLIEMDNTGVATERDVKMEGRKTLPHQRGSATPTRLTFAMRYSGGDELEFQVTDKDGNEYARTSVAWE